MIEVYVNRTHTRRVYGIQGVLSPYFMLAVLAAKPRVYTPTSLDDLEDLIYRPEVEVFVKPGVVMGRRGEPGDYNRRSGKLGTNVRHNQEDACALAGAVNRRHQPGQRCEMTMFPLPELSQLFGNASETVIERRMADWLMDKFEIEINQGY